MATRKLFLIASCLTVLGLLLASCAPSAAPTPTAKPAAPAPTKAQAAAPTAPAAAPTPKPAAPAPTPKPASDQPRYGGILTLVALADAPGWDIHMNAGSTALYPVSPTYSGLLQYDPLKNDQIIGDLAENWEMSPDGTVYTFRLHPGITWHDGKPFSAEDIAFSLKRINKIRTVGAKLATLADVKEMQVTDPHTLKVTLLYPKPALLGELATGQSLILPERVVTEKGDMQRTVVGTGPFKFKSYSAGVSVELVKNEGYFKKGRPFLDGITTYTIRDAATRLAAFRTGQVMMTYKAYGILTSGAEIIEKEMPLAKIYRFPGIGMAPLWMNNERKPFTDVRVRRAISLGYDRQTAIKALAQGAGEIGGLIPPGTFYAMPQDELLKMPGYRQPKDADRTEAKRLLAEAGYPTGFKTTILTRSGVDYEGFAVYGKDQLASIGIDAALDVKEYIVQADMRAKGNYDAIAAGASYISAEPEPIASEFIEEGANWGRFHDEVYNNLYKELSRTVDLGQRKKLGLEMQRRFLEMVPMVVAYWRVGIQAVAAPVQNYTPGIGVYNNAKYQDVWLAK